MKKRRYIIHETNFRDKNGIPLDVEGSENIIEETENLGVKGREWWENQKFHRLGEPFCSEIEQDVEFSDVKLKDGTYYENGLMDVVYTSYDVVIPKRKIRIEISISEEVDVEVSQEEYDQIIHSGDCGARILTDMFEADIYYGRDGNAGDHNIGGSYDITSVDLIKAHNAEQVNNDVDGSAFDRQLDHFIKSK